MSTLATEASLSRSTDLPDAPVSPAPETREIPLAPEKETSSAEREQLGYSIGFDVSRIAKPVKAPTPGPRLMPKIGPLNEEPFWKRALYFLIMAAILVGYSHVMKTFWAPAHAGINQNGYLVGGKNLAEYGTMGVKLVNDYEYLGWMWNLVDRNEGIAGAKPEIWFYPKYPIGTGALFAACLKTSQWLNKGDWDPGKYWAMAVNPVATVMLVAAMFMLTRQVAGSFAGVCGAMIMGCCQVLLAYAEQPLSHSPALACVTWGMYFLYRYWQTASSWRGILAGLCLGYAVTIRYTEGLLILPIAAVLISMVRYDLRTVRWWSMLSWLAIGVVGIWLYGNGLMPFEAMSWPAYTVFGLLMLASALLPILLSQNLVETWESPHDDARVSSMLNYAQPEMRSRKYRWMMIAAHTVRAIAACGLIWAAIFFTKPPATGPAGVDRMFQIVSVKVILLGAVALLYFVPWSQPKRYLKLAVPVLAWLVPTGTLLAYNYLAMGSFSGYDTTNESTAFTYRTFTDKWDDTVQQLYDYSIFMIPPLAVAGMFLMFRWNWRAAMLLMLWFVPGLLLYIAYYYGKQRPGYWYLRFYLTLFPPMVVAAMWLLKAAAEGMTRNFQSATADADDDVRAATRAVAVLAWLGRGTRTFFRGLPVPLGIGIVTYFSCAVGLSIAVPSLEREHAANTNLAYTSEYVASTVRMAQKNAPKVYINDKLAKPVMFAEGRGNPNAPLCNFLQFWGDFELYPSDGFSGGAGLSQFRDTSDSQPNPMQPQRQKYFADFFRTKKDSDIAKDQNKIMAEALEEGRLVFAALQPSATSFFRNRFVTPGGFEMRLVAQWREPVKVPMERSSNQLDPLARGLPMNPIRTMQTFHLYQITRKPKAPTPAVTPATNPSTKPTQVAQQPEKRRQVASQPPATMPLKSPTTAPANMQAPTTAPATPSATPPTTAPTKLAAASANTQAPALAKSMNVLSALESFGLPSRFGPTTKPSK